MRSLDDECHLRIMVMACSFVSVTDRRGDLRNLCFCRASLPILNALNHPYDTFDWMFFQIEAV